MKNKLYIAILLCLPLFVKAQFSVEFGAPTLRANYGNDTIVRGLVENLRNNGKVGFFLKNSTSHLRLVLADSSYIQTNRPFILPENIYLKSTGNTGDVLTRDTDGKIIWATKTFVRYVGATATGVLSFSNSPITDSATLSLTWSGTTASYVRGNGTLDTLPLQLNKSNSTLYTGALGANANGGFNINIGLNAGRTSSTSISDNVKIGSFAGDSSTASFSNIIGRSAGFKSNSSYQNIMGFEAGRWASLASDMVAIGTGAGDSAIYGSSSIYIGHLAGWRSRQSPSAIHIGSLAGYRATNAKNTIFIGSSAGRDDVFSAVQTTDWAILIGQATRTGGFRNSILLGGATDTSAIANTKHNQFMLSPNITHVRWRSVDYELPSTQGGIQTVLTNDGTGTLSWMAPGALPSVSIGDTLANSLKNAILYVDSNSELAQDTNFTYKGELVTLKKPSQQTLTLKNNYLKIVADTATFWNRTVYIRDTLRRGRIDLQNAISGANLTLLPDSIDVSDGTNTRTGMSGKFFYFHQSAFSHKLCHEYTTTPRTHTFQDKTGTVAHLDDKYLKLFNVNYGGTITASLPNEHYLFSASTGAATLMLNTANMPDGTTLRISDVLGIAGTSNITVNAGTGNTIMRSGSNTQTYLINVDYKSITVQKISNNAWIIISEN